MAVPLALFVLFTLVCPRPSYYIYATDLEPDYYYNARLALDGQPTGLHHPGTLIYYLGAVVLKATGLELAKTQQFLNTCYLVVALASIGGLLIFWRQLLRKLPLEVGTLALVLAMAWPTWLSYSNYFGADSFTLAVGLPASVLLWRVFAMPAKTSWWTLILAGAGLGFALAIKMTFVPFAVAAFAGIFVGQLLQPTSTWAGIDGKFARAIRRALLMAIGLVAAFFIGITPAWSKFVAIWYQTFLRPDTHVAGSGAVTALSDTAHLLFKANPLLLPLFALVAGLFALTTTKLFQHGPNAPAYAPALNDFDGRSAAVFLGVLLIFFIYTATTASGFEGDAGVILRNLAPCALFFPLAVVFCHQLRPTSSAAKTRLDGKPYLLAIVAGVTLLAGIYLENRLRMNLVTAHTQVIAATKVGLQAYEVPGARLAFWTSSGENYLGEASFHFWGNYHYGDKLYYPLLLKDFPNLTYFQLRNARRIFEEKSFPPSTVEKNPTGKFSIWWAQVRATLFHTNLPSPLDGGYLYEDGRDKNPTLIAFPAEQMNDPLIQPFTLGELEQTLEPIYGKVTTTRVKFGGIEWLLLTPLPQNTANQQLDAHQDSKP